MTGLSGDTMTGHVAIVGGGPGAPDLITLRGWELLKQADVVLVDHLAPRDLLAGLRDDVEVIDVGKYPHGSGPTVAQDRIEALLVNRARAGLRVVRLKGGDPFLLGRGAEEALACAAADVPFEVVPGVTSAVAVPALAGIPVTHRGLSQEVTIVAGHVAPGDPASMVDWRHLGAGSGTIVVLMGVTHLAAIAAELLAGGRPAQTPAAVLTSGCTPQAGMLVTSLGRLGDDAAAARVAPPAVVVVGRVVDVLLGPEESETAPGT